MKSKERQEKQRRKTVKQRKYAGNVKEGGQRGAGKGSELKRGGSVRTENKATRTNIGDERRGRTVKEMEVTKVVGKPNGRAEKDGHDRGGGKEEGGGRTERQTNSANRDKGDRERRREKHQSKGCGSDRRIIRGEGRLRETAEKQRGVVMIGTAMEMESGGEEEEHGERAKRKREGGSGREEDEGEDKQHQLMSKVKLPRKQRREEVKRKLAGKGDQTQEVESGATCSPAESPTGPLGQEDGIEGCTSVPEKCTVDFSEERVVGLEEGIQQNEEEIEEKSGRLHMDAFQIVQIDKMQELMDGRIEGGMHTEENCKLGETIVEKQVEELDEQCWDVASIEPTSKLTIAEDGIDRCDGGGSQESRDVAEQRPNGQPVESMDLVLDELPTEEGGRNEPSSKPEGLLYVEREAEVIDPIRISNKDEGFQEGLRKSVKGESSGTLEGQKESEGEKQVDVGMMQAEDHGNQEAQKSQLTDALEDGKTEGGNGSMEVDATGEMMLFFDCLRMKVEELRYTLEEEMGVGKWIKGEDGELLRVPEVARRKRVHRHVDSSPCGVRRCFIGPIPGLLRGKLPQKKRSIDDLYKNLSKTCGQEESGGGQGEIERGSVGPGYGVPLFQQRKRTRVVFHCRASSENMLGASVSRGKVSGAGDSSMEPCSDGHIGGRVRGEGDDPVMAGERRPCNGVLEGRRQKWETSLRSVREGNAFLSTNDEKERTPCAFSTRDGLAQPGEGEEEESGAEVVMGELAENGGREKEKAKEMDSGHNPNLEVKGGLELVLREDGLVEGERKDPEDSRLEEGGEDNVEGIKSGFRKDSEVENAAESEIRHGSEGMKESRASMKILQAWENALLGDSRGEVKKRKTMDGKPVISRAMVGVDSDAELAGRESRTAGKILENSVVRRRVETTVGREDSKGIDGAVVECAFAHNGSDNEEGMNDEKVNLRKVVKRKRRRVVVVMRRDEESKRCSCSESPKDLKGPASYRRLKSERRRQEPDGKRMDFRLRSKRQRANFIVKPVCSEDGRTELQVGIATEGKSVESIKDVQGRDVVEGNQGEADNVEAKRQRKEIWPLPITRSKTFKDPGHQGTMKEDECWLSGKRGKEFRVSRGSKIRPKSVSFREPTSRGPSLRRFIAPAQVKAEVVAAMSTSSWKTSTVRSVF